MGYLRFSEIQEHLIACNGKNKLPEAPKSIICLLFPYGIPNMHSNVSKYATIPDYHTIVMEQLSSLCATFNQVLTKNIFVPLCDSSPIPEVRASVTAGLGALGLNNLLIHPTFGSWVFIGTIVTDLVLPPTYPAHNSLNQNLCLQCNHCVTSCPGGALSLLNNPAAIPTFHIQQCLSHITQKKGELTPFEISLIQNNHSAWGCDICQTVCPMNKFAKITTNKAFLNGMIPVIDEQTAETHADRAYLWRGKKVINRNLQILKENKTHF